MTIKTRLVSAFGLNLAVLILVCIVYQQSTGQLLEARRWAEHSQIVLEKLENVVSLCKDLETGQRGFVITSKEDFLEPYSRALGKLSAATGQIRTLTSDNPNQQKRLDRLEDLEASKIAFAERCVELTKSQGTKAAADWVGTRKGKQVMDEVRALVREMQDEERALLAKRTAEADRLSNMIYTGTMIATALAVIIAGCTAFATIGSFSKSVGNLQDGLDTIGRGNLDHKIAAKSNDEFSKLAHAFNDMAVRLKASLAESANQSWLNSGLARLGQTLQGERDLQVAAQKVLSEFASALDTKHGMFYVLDAKNGASELALLASYAHHERKNLASNFAIGQGLVGQCALEKQRIVLTNAPDNYIRISSGVGEASPISVAVVPVVFEGEVKAVIEQAAFHPFSPMQLQYLDQAAVNLGVILNSIAAAERTEKLLRQEQTLTEELQSQQEELTVNNRQLEKLASSLQASEEELRQQQEELQQSNEELEERSRIQAKQNAELEAQNIELEDLRQSMLEKAQQLLLTSKYKSEFLSNMSHELRTPLNSLLILSRVLSENSEGNLTPQQVDFADTIHTAGSDLLVLIDDVLDISKIEAGMMSIEVAEESLKDLCMELMASVNALAKDKGLTLSTEFDPRLPRFVKTDGRRLKQVLKNILSNAIKFTEKGTVKLKVEPAGNDFVATSQPLNQAKQVLSFAVIDTGIGIAADKQRIIFEAFQQADGNTNRKYGGTGLGLAISREIARLLGGEIQLKSEPASGSTFTVYLPMEYTGPAINELEAADQANSKSPAKPPPQAGSSQPPASDSGLDDDRTCIESGDKVLLVVQQDHELTRQAIDLAHARGFKVLCASQGKSAFTLVQRFKPDAIMLDVSLPDKDGWIFFDRLKRDSSTRHIPVHVISDEERAHRARRLGAIGYSVKPASQQVLADMLNHLREFVVRGDRHLLIVEDNDDERQSLEALIEGDDVHITSVSTGHEAFSALLERPYDCMILDLGLPDMTGLELLHKIQSHPKLSGLPVIVHTCSNLSGAEEAELRRSTEAIVIKGAKSAERLLDETTLFLHRVDSNLPEQKRKILERLHLKDPLLSGRKVLIADDDVKHVFAVTSLLEQYDMQVMYADTGNQALAILEQNPGIDLVLMDVMMPEMDGFETTRAIRKLERFAGLPIIALTAKAMKGDREQCIAAGASDYLSKPVDSDQLLSLMRVWLY